VAAGDQPTFPRRATMKTADALGSPLPGPHLSGKRRRSGADRPYAFGTLMGGYGLRRSTQGRRLGNGICWHRLFTRT